MSIDIASALIAMSIARDGRGGGYDCKKCNCGCLFRSCESHCAVQYHTCLLGILSQKLSRVALGRPFFSTFLVERVDSVRFGESPKNLLGCGGLIWPMYHRHPGLDPESILSTLV
jgi:hypothetical protein